MLAVRKYDQIVIGNLAPRPAIPTDVDEVRLAEYATGPVIFISSESNEMKRHSALRNLSAAHVREANRMVLELLAGRCGGSHHVRGYVVKVKCSGARPG